ncbi:GTP-binding protein [Clostridium beijerinckii]|uniref:GTP-binding protein n=1 Tax=Clostridium beijerinckii TaxID=1520 RepID=UPI00098C90D5|nr:GTP-binding protein [Clostridium beijerinckii]MBA8935632.1 G3E family GTPase [Clostridium beijerinckii]NRU40026.1 G3E family GTPase [Clostridium beijerinckii]NSA96696.1 G3E family GTPase [Clostridium beijerinckii]OOM52925.1 CobW/HypB/UreG, nucleotide-binding domain [Clostridium beijerinckii]OOM71740.1 CobW/HypB/UreG, nucleotide-binding domain [Clostridium beijerinckii]
MKIHIEIVTGFLGAGKTSFINSLLKESLVDGEKILVFQLEQGEKKIVYSNSISNFVRIQDVLDIKDLKEKMIYSIKKYKPNRIIIEYNGTSDLKELFDILNERIYRECSKITTVFFVADGKTLKQYIDNMGGFIIPFIQNANMIVINNIDYCKKEILNEGFKKVKKINPKAFILRVSNKYILNSTLREARVLDNGYLKKIKIKMINYKKDTNIKYEGNEENV